MRRKSSEPQVTDAGLTYAPKEEKYDIVADYLDIEVGSIEGQYTSDLLMRMLEEGIGAYQARQPVAFREIFYPTVWLAYLVRLPLSVFERAGLVSDEKTAVDIYAKVLKVVTAALLLFILLKLGVKIPWNELLTFLK